MRTRDQLKLEVVYKVNLKLVDRVTAASVLGVTQRTLRRYLKDYKERSFAFLRHGNKGRAPKNKITGPIKDEVVGLINERYFDFNVTHMREKLLEETGIDIKYDTLKRWCEDIKIKKVRKRRSRPRKHRDRVSQEGYLLQLDGSHHYWFGGRMLCLMAAIDDATGEVFAKFYEGETTWACMDFLAEICRKKGIMHFVYTEEISNRYKAASDICRSGAKYTRASINDCPIYLIESSFNIEDSVQKSVLSLLIAHTFTFHEAQALLEKLDGASFSENQYTECKTVGDDWRALAEAEATKLPRERLIGLADVNIEVQACILANAR